MKIVEVFIEKSTVTFFIYFLVASQNLKWIDITMFFFDLNNKVNFAIQYKVNYF